MKKVAYDPLSIIL